MRTYWSMSLRCLVITEFSCETTQFYYRYPSVTPTRVARQIPVAVDSPDTTVSALLLQNIAWTISSNNKVDEIYDGDFEKKNNQVSFLMSVVDKQRMKLLESEPKQVYKEIEDENS